MPRLLLLLVLLAAPTSLHGQGAPPPLALSVVAETGEVRVSLGRFLEGPTFREPLESGLPVRLRLVTELWRDRFIDALEGQEEWRATILQDPLTDRFLLESPGEQPREVATLAEARTILEGWIRVRLRPTRSGGFYYLARLEVETLSLSDLDELRRWLRGDLAPAVEGTEEVGGALGRGVRRLVVRVFGLPVERFDARTPRFRWAPGESDLGP